MSLLSSLHLSPLSSRSFTVDHSYIFLLLCSLQVWFSRKCWVSSHPAQQAVPRPTPHSSPALTHSTSGPTLQAPSNRYISLLWSICRGVFFFYLYHFVHPLCAHNCGLYSFASCFVLIVHITDSVASAVGFFCILNSRQHIYFYCAFYIMCFVYIIPHENQVTVFFL